MRKELEEMLTGIRWGSLPEEAREQLKGNANVWENSCVIDLSSNLSIAGNVIDTEEEKTIEIDDNAIIYNAGNGILTEGKEFSSNTIEEVLTLSEASKRFNITEGAIRYYIRNRELINGIDYRKACGITLITLNAVKSIFGKES